MISGPLCFGQRSIWRSIRTNPLVDGIRSQLTSLEPLPAGTTGERVRAAVEALWRRHESLRTTFDTTGEDVAQVVHPRARDVLEVVAAGDRDEAAAHARELFATPLRLTGEFGWRVRLITVPHGPPSLAVAVHHILADGWALRRLLAELTALSTDPAPPSPSPVALARDQHSEAWADRRASARTYWSRLTDEFGVAAEDHLAGERISGSVDLGGVSGVVADLVRRHRVGAQTVVLALFALGVRASTGRERILVHLMVANRLRPQWREYVTSLNQIIPAGIVVDDADTFAGLLRQVESAGMAALRNGCHDVDEAAAITGRPPGSVVDHVLNYMLPAWPDLPADPGPAPVTVTASTRPAIAGIYGVLTRGERPVLDLHVDARRYPEPRLRGFLRGTERSLRLLATRPRARVGDLTGLY